MDLLGWDGFEGKPGYVSFGISKLEGFMINPEKAAGIHIKQYCDEFLSGNSGGEYSKKSVCINFVKNPAGVFSLMILVYEIAQRTCRAFLYDVLISLSPLLGVGGVAA